VTSADSAPFLVAPFYAAGGISPSIAKDTRIYPVPYRFPRAHASQGEQCYDAAAIGQGGKVAMPKLVKEWRTDDIRTQARHYVKTYILLPSGFLGLVCMLGGVGTLGSQLVASGTYTASTFSTSTALLLLGGICGWLQTQYHRYLFDTVPEVFAARMRTAVQRTQRKVKAEPVVPPIHHRGRKLVPAAYLVGGALLLGSSAWAIAYGSMEALPATLMPWAGFYWSKLFFWRRVMK
jgi:hypothetical protein